MVVKATLSVHQQVSLTIELLNHMVVKATLSVHQQVSLVCFCVVCAYDPKYNIT